MKKLMTLTAVLLMLALCLCACGGQEAPAKEEAEAPAAAATEAAPAEAATEAAQEEADADAYYVTVVDETGAPIVGAMVQLCSESCFPAATDAQGVAKFALEEAEYKVSFLFMPEGYALADETDAFYFEDGSKEMTITLVAAQ